MPECVLCATECAFGCHLQFPVSLGEEMGEAAEPWSRVVDPPGIKSDDVKILVPRSAFWVDNTWVVLRVYGLLQGFAADKHLGDA